MRPLNSLTQSNAPGQTSNIYDAFISCSDADQGWVETDLRLPLEKAGLKIATSYELEPGDYRVRDLERQINASRRTLVVLTPDWLKSAWNEMEGVLASTSDPGAYKRRLVPLYLKTCADMPSRLASLAQLDFREERRRPREYDRLIHTLQDLVPLPLPWTNWHNQPTLGVGEKWRRWLWRYRRWVWVVLAAWLLLSLVLESGMFQRRSGWEKMAGSFPDAVSLVSVGDAVYVGGTNEGRGCSQPTFGLWHGSLKTSAFKAATSADICVPPYGLANIEDFASAPGVTSTVYASTERAGVILTHDLGDTWQRTSSHGLAATQVTNIVVQPNQAMHLFVSATSGGIWKSLDGGSAWVRLDNQPVSTPCTEGFALTDTMVVGSMVATPQGLVIGTDEDSRLPVSIKPGLYMSRWRDNTDENGLCWVYFAASDFIRPKYDVALAYAADNGSADKGWVLAIEYSFDGAARRLLRFDPDGPTTPPQVLATFSSKVTDLVVQGERWFVATGGPFVLSEIISGEMTSGETRTEFRMWLCWAVCIVKLAPDMDRPAPLALVYWLPSSASTLLRWSETSAWWRSFVF